MSHIARGTIIDLDTRFSPKMSSSKRARCTSLVQSVQVTEEYHGRGLLSRQIAIGDLLDEVLLNIFRHFVDSSPQCWPRLVHVCRKWRHIVFASPLGLRLRLYCTHRTPVLKSLDYWPALPIVVKCGGSLSLDPPTPQDEDNIVAAMKHSQRVASISLTVTSSLMEKIGTIIEPFWGLEDLVLLSPNSVQLVVPCTFRWGPRLRSLHLTRVAFSALPRRLLSSPSLIDLQLHEIPSAGYFSPETFANALSGMTRLQSLSLHFLSLPCRNNHINVSPPSGRRVVLPSLTHLKFRGSSNYLDSLVARIDAPCLGDIEIKFFTQLTYDVSQLGQFFDRIETQKSYHRTDVLTSKRAVSISFTKRGSPTQLRLEISCRQSDWQLSCMAQICNHLPASLLGVGDIGINTTRPSSGKVDVDCELWLELVRSFRHAKRLFVAGKLATDIVRALRSADGGPVTVLPVLQDFYVLEPVLLYVPVREVMAPFVTFRRHRGRSVRVKHLCSICKTCLSRQHELRSHIRRDYESQRQRDVYPSSWSPQGTDLCQQRHLCRQHGRGVQHSY
ncbi:hypothetical protein EDB87DRAFT_1831801 [Lactarius vividus]|nr:hypothetical protein EDB87DRAFT_1831801 [Lactarius vividus]